MQHYKQQSAFNKKKKRLNQYKLLVVLIMSGILLASSFYLSAIFFIALFYLLHELLWSDHIFYNVKQDYQYNLKSDFSRTIDLKNFEIDWQEEYKGKTLLLELELNSHFPGYIFDPFITLESSSAVQAQFFERGLKGRRFVNLSHINEALSEKKIKLGFYYCGLSNTRAILHGFSRPDLSNKKVLLIAPHADDAEIAAFGVYSQNNSFIATITAGEVEAEYYESISRSKQEASRLKGRLRAWDSVSVPLWAGLKPDKVMQLGYFCLTLKTMYQSPDKKVSSLTAGIDDPAYFRSYNQIALKTDKSVAASWNNLVQDLQEIIEREKPDVIMTAHPDMDPHSDHRYATIACLQACEKNQLTAKFLLYTNHYNHTDMFPFGLSGSLHSLAPEFNQTNSTIFPVSYRLNKNSQNDKLMALTMMHDLQTPIGRKKRFRQIVQEKLIGREKFVMGNDDFLRKAVRQNELFFQVTTEQLKAIIDEQEIISGEK